MKKILLICCLIFSFCGCMNNEIKEEEKNSESPFYNLSSDSNNLNDLEDALNDYTNAISGNIKGYDNIDEYISDVKKTDEYVQSVKDSANANMLATLEANGNNLVYKYTYIVPVAENAAELLKKSFESYESTFAASATAIRAEAPCVDKVIWEYYTVDGVLIASFTK